ncbi:MAG: 5'-nucleotidase C-terminal domain-containing protein [Desulfotomaculaceae bacterium]|nr:5'-nucleotidase C-terminal domain-containing protein [Desulfotomaculaceae bacterium]
MFISRKAPRLMSAIALLVFMFALAIPCSAAFADFGAKTFDIIEITDFHGALEDTQGNPVAAVMAKNIKDIVNGNPDRTLIVSCGDNYQGSAASNLLRGVPVMNIFNNIGVAVSGLGNHEFDWGLDTLTKSTITNYPFICSNLFYKGTNNLVFAPYEIFIKDGVKIAVVGAITEDLSTLVVEDYVKDYDVGSIVDNVKQAAQDARANGAQIVVALLHAGDNYDNQTGPVFDVANQLGGAEGLIDAVLGGHTHNLVNTAAANGTPVAIANYNGKGFIDLKITRQADGTLTFNSVYLAGDTTSTVFPYGYKASAPVFEQAVADIVDAAKLQVSPIANQKLGTADTGLTITQVDSPWGESLAGNWAGDVIKAKVNADFAFINNGALRIDIPQGDITMGTLYAFLPFDNTIMTADMTGAQIKTLLEQAMGDGGLGIQVAGLRFAYNPGLPSGSRVLSICKTDGIPVNMTDTITTYRVATNDFMAGGGDGFNVYKTVASFDTHLPIRDALVANIQQTGHISAQIQDRIKNIQNVNQDGQVTRAEFTSMLARDLGLAQDEPAAKFSDVLPGQWFAGAVGATLKTGLVSGYEDGTFRPDAPVSREEMAAIVTRTIKEAGFTAEVSVVNAAIAGFNDKEEISEWAKTSVAIAAEAGIIYGKESGDFAPADNATLTEAVEILERTLSYINSH